MNLENLQTKLKQISDKRDWNQFHSPKNLSMALAKESAELLEIFQWLTEEQSYYKEDESYNHFTQNNEYFKC